MRRKDFTFLCSCAVMCLSLLATNSVKAQTFSGQATAIKSTVITGVIPVPGVTTEVNDTGPLPSAGGSITLQSANATVPNILMIGTSTVSTSGSGNTSQSTASVNTLDVNLTGVTSALRVRADTVSSSTQCSCPAGTCTGSSVITNLRVGQGGTLTVITVTGAPNQIFTSTVGTVTLRIVINEQFASPGSFTVNALHITLTDSLTNVTTDVIVASSHSDITCGSPPPTGRYSGRATGVRLAVSTLIPASSTTSIIADTGFLPTSGGNITVTTVGAAVPGTITTGNITSQTAGGAPGGNPNSSYSNSTVSDLSATLVGGVTITSTLLHSQTLCSCGSATCTGGSQVVGLAVSVLGVPVVITVTGAPNQVVILPAGLGTIIINEQIPVSPASGSITVNALHVILTPVGLASTDLVIASSHSDIQCPSAPTAAGASLSGRVTDLNGRPLARVRMLLNGGDGILRTTLTGSFGYYQFDDVPVGQTYILAVTYKRFQFAPRTLNLSDNLTGLDFSPEQGLNK